MFQVVKRDGRDAEFQLTKIDDAIIAAFNATNVEFNNDIVDMLALRVTSDFQEKVDDGKIHVEDIQDSVERVLGQAGYEEVAKAYILYRKQREKMRAMKSTILDYKDVVNSYVKVEDWRVKENSTVTYSVGGLILSNSGAVTANYWLSEIYDEEIAEAHRNADIHIHDLSMLTGYCAGWSLKQLIKEGLGGITGKITSAPARHLSVLCNQMVNFLGIMQLVIAGLHLVEQHFAGTTVGKTILRVGLNAVIILTGCVLALVLKTDYDFKGILAITVLYLFRNRKKAQMWAGVIIFLLMDSLEMFAALSFILIWFYNGTRGRQNKYFFYFFYPAHLLLLWLVCVAMGIAGIPAI